MQLRSDTEVTREIAAGESHHYELDLEAGQFVRVVAEQQGIVDVAVELHAPGGDLLFRADSPTGRQGSETVVAVAEVAGRYRLEVHDVEPDPSVGTYRLTVEAIHPASPEELRKADAESAFSRAEAQYLAGEPANLRASVDLYREALAMWGELGDRDREAVALLRLGWAHRNLKEYGTAMAFLEKSRERYRETGDGSGEGMAVNSLGGVWIKLWENHEALPLIEQAVKTGRSVGDRFLTAEALNNLGILLNRLERTDEAVDAYTEARAIYQELGETLSLARVRLNLGTLLLKQGKLDNAADNLDAAAQTWKNNEDLSRAAKALTILGDVRRRQGRLDKALQDLKEALALRRRIEDRDGEAVTLNALGTSYLLHKEPDRARLHYEEALKIFEDLGEAQGRALTLVNLGRLHVEKGDPQRALELHRQAVPLVAEAGDLTIEVSNLYGTAKALHDLNDFEAARRQLEATLSKVEDLRSDTRNEGLRIAFSATRQHYYELYIDVLMHLQDDAEAFAAGERRRARALLDALGEQVRGIREHADPRLLEEERSLQAELNDLERRRIALRRLPTLDEKQIAQIREQQRATVLELEKVRGKLRTELAETSPLSLDEARFLLTPGTLLLAYSLGDERSFLWQVSREKVKSHILPGRYDVEEVALEAHRLLTSRNEDDDSTRARLLAQLSDTLLGPLAADLDGQRLLIVAEGVLLQLPFAALPGPSGMENAPDYLVRRHETVYLPSVSVLRTLRERASERYSAPKQMALFADPVFVREGFSEQEEDGRDADYEDRELQRSVELFGTGNLASLPHTRDEAEGILEITRGDVMKALGFEATKKKVLEGNLGRYKFLHFATHALVHRDQPELSGLVLSLFNEKGEYQDGFLRLHEIYNLDLSAELVVLSACQTGVGRQVRGEGFLGLTRGFLYAGATRLIVSLWSVDDRGTAELMKRFYWNLLEGKAPPSLALRTAQRSMLAQEQWRHPYYWAGFVFQGEWFPPGSEPPIGAAEAGGVEEEPRDPGYPGPGKDCESLPEPWMRELCKLLRELSGD